MDENFKVEIVEFYPHKNLPKKKILEGTLHVFLCDWGVDLRGIAVRKHENKWYFGMPLKWAYDEEEKTEVAYPIFTFANKEHDIIFRKIITNLGKEYITQNFLNMEKVLKGKSHTKKTFIKKTPVDIAKLFNLEA